MLRFLLSAVLVPVVGAVVLALGSGRSDRVATPASPPTRDCAGKPGPDVGALELHVVERRAPDRVTLEASWTGCPLGLDRTLRLVLPPEATRLKGPASIRLAAEETGAEARWEIAFPTGRALDAAVRVETDSGAAHCSREAYVRLADAAPSNARMPSSSAR